MSFVMHTSDHEAIELGPTLGVLQFFQRIARISPDEEFGYLHGIPHHIPEEFARDDLRQTGDQARRFLDAHADEVTDFDRAVLAKLVTHSPDTSGGQ
jgi:hypothetical protein